MPSGYAAAYSIVTHAFEIIESRKYRLSGAGRSPPQSTKNRKNGSQLYRRQHHAAGGKSGQHEPPYFLTGRRQEGKRPADSKCRRKQTAPQGVRVKTRGKSSRQPTAMPADGKPYGLKDQIYRQSRAGSPVVGGVG